MLILALALAFLVNILGLWLATKMLGFENQSISTAFVVVLSFVLGGIASFIISMIPVVGWLLALVVSVIIDLALISSFYRAGWVMAFVA